VEDGFRGAFTPAAKAAIREDEQKAGCRFFGLPDDRLTFLRLTEDDSGHLAPGPDNLARVKEYLLNARPDLVFLPHGNDTNADHQRVFALFREIVQNERLMVTAFLNRDPKTIAMRPDLYTGFDDEAARWKGELLRLHQSQHQRNLNTRQSGFDDRILSVNRAIAREMGGSRPYAESFEIWAGLGMARSPLRATAVKGLTALPRGELRNRGDMTHTHLE
jgi:LmbE family N-acetylglucosaminyl deacetylase